MMHACMPTSVSPSIPQLSSTFCYLTSENKYFRWAKCIPLPVLLISASRLWYAKQHHWFKRWMSMVVDTIHSSVTRWRCHLDPVSSWCHREAVATGKSPDEYTIMIHIRYPDHKRKEAPLVRGNLTLLRETCLDMKPLVLYLLKCKQELARWLNG